MAKEPLGGKTFDGLMRDLSRVPKRELDRAEKRYQKRKAKWKKKR